MPRHTDHRPEETSVRRRQLLTQSLAVAACAAPTVWAQTYPSRPIRIVIGFPPGGGIDIVARLLAPRLSDSLGQAVVIENKPGANGVLGMDTVAKAAPDGHTVLLGTLGNFSVNPALYANLPYQNSQLAPLTLLASVSFMLFVNPALPWRHLEDLIAHGKAHPGHLNFGSSGSGGLPHLAGELFAKAAGLRMTHVPYKGSALSINDVMAGQLQMTFEAAAAGLQHVKTGRLRALASLGPQRLPFMNEVPTVAETLPGFQVVNWYGMACPAGTPREYLAKLHEHIARALAHPEIREKMVTMGTDPVGSSPEEFGRFWSAESLKWGRVVKDGNITAG
jgi:tripartite-type tricarboxylate transporter receptor subunit TctC